jgi:hypothetical protein
MATFYFQRDTKVYIHVPTATAGTPAMYYEIPVLDGYSFSQATNASEITLNQAQDTDGNSIRARQMFNDSFAPAEWSFSTYISPYLTKTAAATYGVAGAGGTTDSSTTLHREVSEALWGMFFAQTLNNVITTAATAGGGGNTSGLDINTTNSDKATLGVFDLYFVLGGSTATSYAASIPDTAYADTNSLIYKIANCSVNEFSFDFDIDGLATIAWSGQGKVITEESGLDMRSSALGATLVTEGNYSNATGAANTTGFIRNRVSDLTLSPASLNAGTDYATTLTGGNITGSNNLTYLTPETLGVVNQPLGHITGTRNIGGNFTCYLDNTANASAELFEDIIESTSDITNSVGITFDIGASTAPYTKIVMPTAHLEVPTINVEDVISLETNFHALPATLTGANEITDFNFFGVAVG